MVTAGITMVRNEKDIIATTLLTMAWQVDLVIVADNMSDDGTRKILDDLAAQKEAGRAPIYVIDDNEVAYYQSKKMTNLARYAAFATINDKLRTPGSPLWIVPFDADEIWSAGHNRRIGSHLDSLPAEVTVSSADLYNHYRTGRDVNSPNPVTSMSWCFPEPGQLPKVAFRYQPSCVIHQGNHGVDLPYPGSTETGQIRVDHYPYRSAEQFIAKAKQGAHAYAVADLPEDFGDHWRSYGKIIEDYGEQALADVFAAHFHYENPMDAGMVEYYTNHIRGEL